MTFATRLYTGFAVILTLMLVTTIIGVVNVNNTDRRLATVSDIDSAEQRYAINFRGSVHDRAIAVRDAVLTEDSAARRGFYRDIDTLKAFYQEAAENLNHSYATLSEPTREERQLLQAIQTTETRTLALTQELISALDAGDNARARQLLITDVSPAYSEWLSRINALIDHQEGEINARINRVRQGTGDFQKLMLTITLIALITGGIIAYRTVRRLVHIIGGEPEEAMESIRLIASGDLTADTRTKHPRSIMAAVGTLSKDLNGMIREMTEAADDLAAASSQLSDTAKQNMRSSEEQHRLTEMGAAAINEMATTVDEVARHTVEAAQVATEAGTEFARGESEVSRNAQSINALADEVRAAAQAIEELAEKSRSIGTVISVIEDIADQTNLLALNAAIEAARAGDHGRGFAVVADEVRGLATRTQDSTREIQQLVETIQAGARHAVEVMERGEKQTALSVEQAQRAGEALQSINALVTRLNDMNAQIATAAEQQSAVAEEINSNFTDITDRATSSAAGSRQVDAAGDDLKELAQSLQQHVRKFRVS